MFLPLFSHRDTESLRHGRSRPPWLREARLVFRQGPQSPEAPREQPQTVLERLTDEHVNEEDLEKTVAELPEESDVYRAVVAEGQKLDTKQRQIVGVNMKRLSERIEQRAKTQTDQVKVLAKVERMRTALSAPPEAPEKSLWTRGWEQAGKYWDQTPPAVKAVSVGLGVAAFAYGGYRLVKWLWGGTKEVVEKTKEGAHWLRNTLLVGGGLVVAGALGYLGFKIWERRMKEFVGDIKDAAKEKVLAAKQMAEEQLARVESAIQKGAGLAEEKLEELQEEKRKLAEKIAECDRALEERRTQPTAQSKSGEAETRTQKATELTREAAEVAGEALLAKGIMALYPPSAKYGAIIPTQVNDFIGHNKQRKVKDFFECVHVDESTQGVRDIAIDRNRVRVLNEDFDRREAAAFYVIEVCWKAREELHRLRPDLTEEQIGELTVDEYVDAFARGAESLAMVVETVAVTGVENLKDALKPEALFIRSGAVRHELTSQIDAYRKKPGVLTERFKDIDPMHVVEVAVREGETSVHGFLEKMAQEKSTQAGQEGDPVRELLADVCNTIEGETPSFILPFFHKLFPDRDWSGSEAENRQHVSEILLDRMSLAQAVRLFLYQRMVQKGNPTGLLLIQVEIFRYVGKNDTSVDGYRDTTMLDRIGRLALAEGADEWQKSFVDVPPEVFDKAKRAISFLTVAGAKAALGAAAATARETAGVLHTIYGEHPWIAYPLTGVAAYAAKMYSHLSTRPYRVLRRLGDASGRTQARNIFMRTLDNTILHPWRASPSAVRDANAVIKKMDEIINGLVEQPATAEMGNRLCDQFVRTMRPLDSRRAWEQLVDFLQAEKAKLPVGDPAIVQLDELISRASRVATESSLRKAVRLGARPLMNVGLVDRTAAAGNTLLTGATYPARRLHAHWMNSWRSASPFARAAYVGGVGLQGLALYADYQEIGEIEKQRDAADKHVRGVIDQLHQDLDRNPHFTRLAYGRYQHKVTGVEVSLQGVNKVIDSNVGRVFDDREMAQKLRTANTAAGLAATILMGAKAFTGPAGLVVVGVEVAIRTGINAWEQSKMREFLADAPPWLLCILGSQAATGEGEYDWLERGSSWMLSDFFPSSKDSAADGSKDKPEIRKRMLYSIFVRELMQNAPEVFAESVGGMWSPDVLDRFYREDFAQFVLPMFSAQLFAAARAEDIPLQAAQSGDIGVNALGLTATNVTLMDIREAMRRASVCYLQHVREKRYLEYRSFLGTIAETDERHAGLVRLVNAMGGVQVFGRRLNEIPPELLAQNNGKTRAELSLQALLGQLNQTSGGTRAEKVRQNERLFVVSPSSVSGLSAAIDFGNRDQLFGLVDDPAMQLKLKQLTAQTLGEEEADKRRRWNDWSLSRLTHQASAVDQLDALFYAAPFHAANMIAEKLGEPPVHQNTSILDLVGRSRDAASYDAARTSITEGLDRLSAKTASGAALRRSPSYDELYGANGPVVFTRGAGHPDRRLARLIKYPKAGASGFETNRLQAVLLERQDLGGNHTGVLATYIFGDLDSGKVSVLQRGAGTFRLSSMPDVGLIDGLDRPLTLQEFLARPGAETLLQEAKKALMERRQKAEEEKRQRAQQAEQAQQTASDTWQKEAPKRAETIAAQTQLRTAALAQIHTGMVGYVPGEYQVDDQHHQMRRAPGLFRGRFGDADVEISDIQTASAMSSSAPEIEPTPFRFQVLQGGKSQNFTVTLDTLRAEPSSDFTREDQQLTRDVLVTPMNLAGHPRARDPAFVESVRHEELGRILRMAQYRGGNGWTGREYLSHLHQELWPSYRDAENKSIFLNTLLNNLMTEGVVTGGVFSSPYRRILANMKHQW